LAAVINHQQPPHQLESREPISPQVFSSKNDKLQQIDKAAPQIEEVDLCSTLIFWLLMNLKVVRLHLLAAIR
jgi:hypothetical protein